jgi:hypothetical protein
VSAKTFSRDDRARAVPSRAQLLVLVAAEKERELTPGETRLLCRGVEHLSAQLEVLRDERDAAVRERDEAQAGAGSPLSVPCGYCRAPIGRRCVAKVGGTVLVTPHTARLHALRSRAERLDLPVSIQQLAASTAEVDRELRRVEPRLKPVRPPLKSGCGPDDARRIAARLEAGLKGAQR